MTHALTNLVLYVVGGYFGCMVVGMSVWRMMDGKWPWYGRPNWNWEDWLLFSFIVPTIGAVAISLGAIIILFVAWTGDVLMDLALRGHV